MVGGGEVDARPNYREASGCYSCGHCIISTEESSLGEETLWGVVFRYRCREDGLVVVHRGWICDNWVSKMRWLNC